MQRCAFTSHISGLLQAVRQQDHHLSSPNGEDTYRAGWRWRETGSWKQLEDFGGVFGEENLLIRQKKRGMKESCAKGKDRRNSGRWQEGWGSYTGSDIDVPDLPRLTSRARVLTLIRPSLWLSQNFWANCKTRGGWRCDLKSNDLFVSLCSNSMPGAVLASVSLSDSYPLNFLHSSELEP